MPDAAYATTRREGVPVTVVYDVVVTTNPETGVKSQTMKVKNVKQAAMQATSYGRMIKANAAQQDIGSTAFVFWKRDVPFLALDVEDYVIVAGVKYQVVTTDLERTSIYVTTNQVRGSVPVQVVSEDVSQPLALADGATPSVT